MASFHANPDIRGITIGDYEYKFFAFADDLLVYITNPHISLPSLMSELVHYSDWSNYKMNLSKSEALNITLPPHTVTFHSNGHPWALPI